MCHAVRAPGSHVRPESRDDSAAENRDSTRTEPVKYCASPWLEGCEPLREIVIDGSAPAERAPCSGSMDAAVEVVEKSVERAKNWLDRLFRR